MSRRSKTYRKEVLGKQVWILFESDDEGSRTESEWACGTITSMREETEINLTSNVIHRIEFDGKPIHYYDLSRYEENDSLSWTDPKKKRKSTDIDDHSAKKSKSATVCPKSIKKERPKSVKSKPLTIITLMDIITKEKGMVPSRGGGRKGRDEREFLRFYQQFGVIQKPPGREWKWNSNDPELELARKAMDKFKNGMRQPHNFREFSRWQSGWTDYEL